jgi:hypothetical protein
LGDLSRRPSAHRIFEQRRFGKPLSEFDPERRKNHLFGEYQPPLSLLADIAGFDIDEWTAEGGVVAAKQDMQLVAGPLKQGTAAAQRVIIHGRCRGVERMRFTQYGFVGKDVDPDWGCSTGAGASGFTATRPWIFPCRFRHRSTNSAWSCPPSTPTVRSMRYPMRAPRAPAS